jgi:hypothetical protein
MAKPPIAMNETSAQYERRLLNSGWYDRMPPEKRVEAERIAAQECEESYDTPVERTDAFWRNEQRLADERHERRKAPQGHAAAPQAPEAQPLNSAEDDRAEARAQNQKRIWIATIALIVILSWLAFPWQSFAQPFPVSR